MTMHDLGPAWPAKGRWDDLPALLEASERDEQARELVVTLLYPELKRIAETYLAREPRDQTLQAVLVSDFVGQVANSARFLPRTRTRFLIVAAVAVRRLLVDYARTGRAETWHGEALRVDVECTDASQSGRSADILEIDQLLSQLGSSDPRLVTIVELRFFGGLTNGEVGLVLGLHERTIARDWRVARAWLYSHLRLTDSDESSRVGDS